MSFDSRQLALLWYFGDLQYWKLPDIATDALLLGYDGQALRRMASLVDFVAAEVNQREIDSLFREMGVEAPIPKDQARLQLARQSAENALSGSSNVFDEATHIRIHLCELFDPPPELSKIVTLSKQARNAPREEWPLLEDELQKAFEEFVAINQVR